MHGRTWIVGLVLALLVGCDERGSSGLEEASEPAPLLAQAFDRTSTGGLRGRVTWQGPQPVKESTLITRIAFHLTLHENPVRYETTHIPQVNAVNQGIADAVVFLRGVDPRRSRPWDHEPVHIEFSDRRLLMRQGSQSTNVGLVRVGDKLTGVNRDVDYHALRGRGAAFFTLPLATQNLTSERTLKQPGLVELFDAAGYYWVHAHVFVADHPYYARTDADGNFTLEQVPAGSYEMVCWMPSWKLARQERDSETAVLVRNIWRAPVEQVRAVQVQTGQTQDQAFTWSLNRFDGP